MRGLAPFTLGLLCLLCPASWGQVNPSDVAGPSSEQVQQWLASSDARTQAWGAHAALESHRTELLPALIGAITRAEALKAHGPGDERHAEAAILDALIQLDGNLPVDVLAGLDGSLWTQEVVLLARLPWSDAEPLWKTLYQPVTTHNLAENRVAAEMLARNGSVGFAARLLSTIQVRMIVDVHDPGESTGLDVGAGSGCCGSGVRDERPWPAMGAYLFEEPRALQDPPAGAELWLAGRDPIYLLRQVTTAGWAGGCGSGLRPLDDAMRSHLAGRLLGDPASSPFPETTVHLDIAFTEREAYRKIVAEAVDAQQANFRLVGERLAARGLLTERERQDLDLPIELLLYDTRSKPAEDLPAIAFREPVRWVTNLH